MDDEELVKIYEAHIANGASDAEAQRAVDLAVEGKAAPVATLAAQKRLAASGNPVGDMVHEAIAALPFAGRVASKDFNQRTADLEALAPESAIAASKVAGMVPLFAAGPAAGLSPALTAGGVAGLEAADKSTGSLPQRAAKTAAAFGIGTVGGKVADLLASGTLRSVDALRAARKVKSLGNAALPAIEEEIRKSREGFGDFFSRRAESTAARFKEQQQALADQAEAMSTGVSDLASKKLADVNSTAGSRVAEKLRGVAKIEEPVDKAVQRIEQGKRTVSAEGYQPIEQKGPITSDRIMEFLKMPEIARDVRAVGIKPGEAPKLSQLQDLRNRFRSGSNQDRDMFGQLNRLMSEDIPKLTESADAPYALLSQKGRAQELAIKAGNWNSAKIRLNVGRMERVSPEVADEFRRNYVENNIVSRLQQKETGAPYLESLLKGGPEMDARLQAVLTPDQFRGVQNILAEERAKIANIGREKEIGLSKILRQREAQAQSLGQQQYEAEQALLGERGKTDDWLSGLDKRVGDLNAQRAQLEKSAADVAKRIKSVLTTGALVGAGWKAGHLVGASLP